MSTPSSNLAIALFSEIITVDQLVRDRVGKALPKGMELSHFSVLNQLAHTQERSPAQLAKSFHVTRGAMTNTLNRLETAGYIHVRPDWDDARSKRVSISPAGRLARDEALRAIEPLLTSVVEAMGESKARAALPTLRELRRTLEK
jgi:DNA-binding MarR family transcriptional regulator